MNTKQTLENFGFTITGADADQFETVEIPNPVKRKPGRYPQPGWTPTVTVTRPVGSVGKDLAMTGRPSAFLSLWEAAKSNTLPMRPDNASLIKGFCDDSKVAFRGGTVKQMDDQLAGLADMEPFFRAKEKLEAGSVIDTIRRELETLAPRRRRVWSDNGQWVEDRRFEPEAFEDFKRTPSPARSIHFNFECSENCDIDARKLAEFGATAWAIVDLLEASGLSVSVDLNYSGRNIFNGNETNRATVRLKECGEYISPSFMAGVMSPNFFRRVIFVAITTAADCCNKNVYSGLGYAKQFKSPVSYYDGAITMSSQAIAVPTMIADAVLQAIRSVFRNEQAA